MDKEKRIGRHARLTSILLMGYRIKVWEWVPELLFGPNHDLTVGVRAAITGEEGSLRVDPAGISQELDKFPDVMAYEITDSVGNGIMVVRRE